MMMKYALAMMAATVLSAAAFAQGTPAGGPVQTMDVQAAVDAALRGNLGLQRTKQTTDAKKRIADRSWNSLVPTLSASSAQSKANASGSDWTPTETLSASISLNPALVSAMKKAAADYNAGQIDYAAARRSLELSVRESFNQLLLYKANIEIAQRKIDTAKAQYDQTAAMAALGQASKVSALSARVDWEALKPKLTSAQVTYRNALDEFKLALGLESAAALDVQGDLSRSVEQAALASLARLGDSSDAASYRAAAASVEAAKKASKESSFLPTLGLSYSKGTTYAADQWTGTGTFQATLSLKLDPFLPGSAARETLDEYDDSLDAYRSQIAQAQRASDAAILKLKRSVVQYRESIEAGELNVKLAEETYALQEDAYKKGASDLQTLKSAGDSLEEARYSVLEQRYSLANSLLELENEANIAFGSLGRQGAVK